MAELIVDRYEDETAWRGARDQFIGASESAAILGVSRYDTPLSLYFDKLGMGEAKTDKASLFRIGTLMEPVIAALYIDDAHEERTVMPPVPFATYRHSDYPEWMRCTPDRLINASPVVPLELKNVDWRMGADWTEEPPVQYIIQLQHQMACLGADEGILAALVGGNSFRWAALKRDDAFIDDVLLPALVKFRWHLEQHIPPESDAAERTREALRAAYPKHVPNKVISFGPEFIDWDQQRTEAAMEIEAAEAKKREAENAILLALADAERGELPNGVAFTNKLQTKPAGTTKECSFRVLRRSEKKAKG